jgi:beta-lactamase regulating signal transducer with metallopeptidase domain
MWIYTLLPQILNMSITASIVIILVLAARFLLKKAPKVFSYALWAVVLFRLICPVSFSSPISLIGFIYPSARTVDNGAYSSLTYIPTDMVPQVDLPVPGINGALHGILHEGGEGTSGASLEFPMAFATMLWLFGIGVMMIYGAVSLIRLRRKLTGAVRLRENIYLADHIVTPFVIGILRPKIYLPSTLRGEEQSYVILHEQTHIRRQDHLVKMFAFLVLVVHWFNPLVWVAFVFIVKDMEMSCDERVIKLMGDDIRGEYSTSLLSLSAGKRLINGGMPAFSEENIKGRIRNVMNYKTPAAWVVILSILFVVALSVGLALNKYLVTLNVENIADAILTTEIEGWYPLAKGTPYHLNEEELNSIIELVNKSSKKPILDKYKPTYGDLYKTYCTIQFVMAGANGVSEGTYRLQLYNHKDWTSFAVKASISLRSLIPTEIKCGSSRMIHVTNLRAARTIFKSIEFL